MAKSAKISRHIIDRYFGGSEVKATNYFRRVSKLLSPQPNPSQISVMIETFPNLLTEPQKLAERLAKHYTNLTLLPPGKPSPAKFTGISNTLVKEVAKILKPRTGDPTGVATQMLLDLEKIATTLMKRSSERQIIRAFRRAAEAGPITVDTVILEMRKIIYGYRGDPDEIREISVPMGGKLK